MTSTMKRTKMEMIKNTLKTATSLMTILLLISLTGCQGGFFKGRGPGQLQTYDFRQGTEGIAMQFMEGMPPERLYVGTPFSLGLRIKNRGAYSITDRAQVRIIPPASAFSFDEGDTKQFALQGRSLYAEEGEEDILMFPMRALCYPGYEGTKASTIVKNYTAKLQATACYNYETTANADLCVDTRKHLREKGDRPVCNMQPISFSGGQGGPVGVVSVSPSIIPRSQDEMDLQLTISVKNLAGTGVRIFHHNADCWAPKEQDKVELDVQMGGQKMWCEPYQVQIKQTDSVSTICTTPVDPDIGAYTTPLSINMKYKVKQNRIRSIAVEPPPAGIDCDSIKAGSQTP